MFAALSQNNPKIENHLKHFIALGPVAWVRNIGATILKIAAETHLISVLELFKINEFLPWNLDEGEFLSIACDLLGVICKDALKSLMDADPDIDNLERLDILVGHFPAGTSTRNLDHWA